MDISAILPGDIIEAELRGSVFLATVEERLPDDDRFDLKIKPIQRHITNFHVEAHDVTAHYKKMGRRRGRPPKSIEAPNYDPTDEEMADAVAAAATQESDRDTQAAMTEAKPKRSRPGPKPKGGNDDVAVVPDRAPAAEDGPQSPSSSPKAAPAPKPRPRPGAKAKAAPPKPRARPGAKAGAGNPFVK